MRFRKQRFVIDAVLNLVQDIKLANSQNNTLSYLLLDIKKAFDHVSL